MSPNASDTPSQSISSRQITCVSLAVASLAVLYGFLALPGDTTRRDFHQIWFAARALFQHQDPYQLIGPGRSYPWRWPFYYPLPAALLVAPIAWLPPRLAFSVFDGIGAGLLTFGLLRHRGIAALWILCSGAMVRALAMGQWSPILTAAFLLPALQFVYVGKPSVGAGLWLTRPRNASLMGMAFSVALIGLSVVIQPHWILEWIDAIKHSPHITAPIGRTLLGMVLIPLLLIRWRDADARLVFALACVPQTPALYEALPVLLTGRRWQEYLALSVLTSAAEVWVSVTTMGRGLGARFEAAGPAIVYFVYLPCVALVFLRPHSRS